MIRRLSRLVTAAVGLSVLLAAHAAERRVATARWETGTEPGTDVLVLEFAPNIGAVETAVRPGGLQIRLEGADVAGTGLPAGLESSRDASGTILHVSRPGAAVQSVRYDASAVRIVLSSPAQRDPDAPGSPAYKVGIGDVLTIAVYKNPDLSGDVTVAPDGTLSVPLVGSVAAAGQTEAELAATLTQKLAATYLVDPQVTVTVKTYQSQFVYVTGAVPHAGRVAVRPGLTLRGVLAEVEVPMTSGVSVELRHASGETTVLAPAALDAADAPLPRAGDVLTVLESNFVSIYGEVRRPTRLVLTSGMTLLQAIAMAEGLTEWANKKKVQILRKGENGTGEVLVNLNAIEHHETEDPRLHPEDVIIVGRRIL